MKPGGGRDEADAGGREEIRFHLDAQARDLVAAGWDPEAAREEARRRFGDPERVTMTLAGMERRRQRRARRRSLVGGLLRDGALAFRQLRRHPTFAATSMGVMALGFGLAGAVFAVVDALLLRPLPFPAPEHLVAVSDLQDGTPTVASLPEFRDWARDGDFFHALAAWVQIPATLTGDRPERVEVGMVAGDWLAVTGLVPVAGRGFTPEELEAGAGVAMIGEERWRREGAAPGVVGSTVTLDGWPVRVVGVMPAGAGIPVGVAPRGGRLDFWMPLRASPSMERGLHFLRVVGRLEAGVDAASARARARALATGFVEAGVTEHGIDVVPLRERLAGESRHLARVLAGAVALVLLAVVATLAGLWTAHTLGRRREFAVRASLGAGAARIGGQVATEAAVTGFLAGLLSLGVARLVVGLVARAAGSGVLTATVSATHPRVVAFTLLGSTAGAVLVGWAPARRAVGTHPGRDLGGNARDGGTRSATGTRRALLAVQVALGVVLLASAGLLVRSASRLLARDPGFDARGVVAVPVSLPSDRYPDGAARAAFWRELQRRAAALPGVEAAGLVHTVPLRGNVDGGISIPGRPEDEASPPWAVKQIAGPGALEALGVELREGRTFRPSDAWDAPQVALVSESLARRYWPDGKAVGERVRFSWMTDREQEIVGVVGDIRDTSLDGEPAPTIYASAEQLAPSTLHLVLRAPRASADLLDAVRGVVADMDASQPLGTPLSLEQLVRSSVGDVTTLGRLLGAFAVLALLLAAVGLYGVAAQTVLARRREIGLRMAMGARRGEVAGRVVRAELAALLAGLALGLPGAVVAGRFLQDLLFETRPGDPTVLAAVGGLLLATGLLALTLPAVRAARTDPAAALREG